MSKGPTGPTALAGTALAGTAVSAIAATTPITVISMRRRMRFIAPFPETLSSQLMTFGDGAGPAWGALICPASTASKPAGSVHTFAILTPSSADRGHTIVIDYGSVLVSRLRVAPGRRRAVEVGLRGLERASRDEHLASLHADERLRDLLGLSDVDGVGRDKGWRRADLRFFGRRGAPPRVPARPAAAPATGSPRWRRAPDVSPAQSGRRRSRRTAGHLRRAALRRDRRRRLRPAGHRPARERRRQHVPDPAPAAPPHRLRPGQPWRRAVRRHRAPHLLRRAEPGHPHRRPHPRRLRR